MNGNGGAYGIGFYGTNGSAITSVTVTVPSGAFGFAVGEFAFAGPAVSAVPEPSTLTLLGIGAICSLGYSWRRRRQSA